MLSWTKLRVLQLWSTVRWNIHMWTEWQDLLTSPRLPQRQKWICIHRNFCKYGLVTFSFTKVISLRVKKLGYSVVPFHVIYLSIHHVLIDLLYKLIYFLLIFQNSCESIPCAHHATCQAGFGNHGYRCICPAGYQGVQCKTGEGKNI